MKTIFKDFDLNSLKILIALEKARNVSRAAELMNMSQSGFSTALARLRVRLGDELFVRIPGGMEPTSRAIKMVEAARHVLLEVEAQILEEPNFDPKTDKGEFHFALTDVAEIVFMPLLLKLMQTQAPNITVHCSTQGQADLKDLHETGKIDLSLGFFPDLESNGFYQQRLYSHTFACMVRKNHPILKQGLNKENYQTLGHAAVSSPARSNQILEKSLDRYSIKRNITLETPHYLTLPSIIKETNLVASVPLAIASYFADLGIVEILALPFRPPVFSVRQYWHKRVNQDPKHKWLRHQMVNLFNKTSDPWLDTEISLYGNIRNKGD